MPSYPRLMLFLLAATGAVAALGLLVGHADLADRSLRQTLLGLRASRLAVSFLAGASLSVGGVMVQGLFNNPLASPSILGTTAGASLGGQAALFAVVVGMRQRPPWLEAELVLPLGCVAGALGALIVLLLVTRFQRDLVVLLLVGFLLSSLFLSVGAFLTSVAQQSWEVGRAMIAFTLGSTSGAGQRQVLLVLPFAAAGTLAAALWARPLDLLLSGEEEAQSLGLDVAVARRWLVIWTAVLTAGAVASAGNVGFVGLIAPHAVRRFVGVGHRRLVPAAALGGGLFLMACDVLSRSLPTTSEVPLGVITGVIGAPLFLSLLISQRKRYAGA
jgi:iron complex transport system permease protein